MRHINKGQEPKLFADWKALENENWLPIYSSLSGQEKKAVKGALITEQGGICCYCERRLVESDSHIEHCQPQHLDEVDALDFANLICSCQQVLERGDPRHCGNLKDKWYDDQMFVSPLKLGCKDRFSFDGNGAIDAADPTDKAVKETISRLGLGIPKLNNLRKMSLEPFLDGSLSDDDLKRFVSGYLKKTDDGTLSEFVSAIACVFGEFLAA